MGFSFRRLFGRPVEDNGAGPLSAAEAARSVGDLRNIAQEYVAQGAYAEAIPLLRRALQEAPARWEHTWHLHYLLGQSLRFTADHEGALQHLREATRLKTDDPSVWLAFGIALQTQGEYEDAKRAFAQALDIDRDHVNSYNSLALTQKMMGELDKALHNYDAGILAITRLIMRDLVNDRSAPIYPHVSTRGHLWLRYAFRGALRGAAIDDIGRIAYPTDEMAAHEERTQSHGGLCFVDQTTPEGETVRLYLPNFFNMFREWLFQDSRYSMILHNRAVVLELVGDFDEARLHFEESEEFAPKGR